MAVQQIGPGTSGNGTPTTPAATATPAGATVVAFAYVRTRDPVSAAIVDSGGNTWTQILGPVLAADSASVQGFAWVARNTTPLTTVSVTFTTPAGGALTGIAGQVSALAVTDMDSAVPVVSAISATPAANVTPYPAASVTLPEADGAVVASLGVGVTTRTIGLTADAASSYTALTPASANQMQSRYTYRENAGTATTGPVWETTAGGSPVPAVLMTVGLRRAAPPPPEPETLHLTAVTPGPTAVLAGAADGVTALSDGSDSSFLEAELDGPTELCRGPLPPIQAPTDGLSVVLRSSLSPAADADLYAELSRDNGVTWLRSSVGTTGPTITDQVVAWTQAQIVASLADADWSSMLIRVVVAPAA